VIWWFAFILNLLSLLRFPHVSLTYGQWGGRTLVLDGTKWRWGANEAKIYTPKKSNLAAPFFGTQQPKTGSLKTALSNRIKLVSIVNEACAFVCTLYTNENPDVCLVLFNSDKSPAEIFVLKSTRKSFIHKMSQVANFTSRKKVFISSSLIYPRNPHPPTRALI